MQDHFTCPLCHTENRTYAVALKDIGETYSICNHCGYPYNETEYKHWMDWWKEHQARAEEIRFGGC